MAATKPTAKAVAPAPAAPAAKTDVKAAAAMFSGGSAARSETKAPAPPGGASVTRLRGAAGGAGGSVSATPLAMAGQANAVNPLHDGMTFIEKDCVQSVQKLVDLLQRKDAPDQNQFRKVLAFALTFIETGSLAPETQAALASEPTYLTLFTGVHDLVCCAIRTRVKEKDMLVHLNQIAVPGVFANDIYAAFTKRRDGLEAAAASSTARNSLAGIADVQWRVDVAVSTTALSRVFRPSIIMQLTLTDGTIKTFECSVDKFHELRYAVAKLLKSMQDLEQHPTLTRSLE